MSMIEPFAALRVRPDRAESVSAPPYDVVDTQEARALAADNPDSFLHVSKPEIDCPDGTDPHADEVYAAGRAALARLVDAGHLVRDRRLCYYGYRLVMGSHRQTGLVGAAGVAHYREGRIKQHEHTQPDKVRDRARNADALNAHAGTLFLTYRADERLDGFVHDVEQRSPDTDFVAPDGIRHTLWVIDDEAEVELVRTAFEAMSAVYIADGHHRAAAAEMLWRWRSEARAAGAAVSPADRFLAVLFPHDRVQILPYHRVVSTLGGRTAEQFLQALQADFELQGAAEAVQARQAGEFGLYLEGRWWSLKLRPGRVPDGLPGRLDVNLLSRYCLEPLLGIVEQRTDERIDFVGGIRGAAQLQQRVDSGRARAAFTLPATRLEDVLAIADAGEVMPTKSTWFEPKLRDGLLVLPLE